MPVPIAQEKLDWVSRVLGMQLDGLAAPTRGATASGAPVRAKPVDPGVAPPTGATLFDRPPSGAAITPAFPAPPRQLAGANGRMLGIARAPDGRVSLTAPPPPVQEITFSGGGGKGAALPGAIKALHASGMLNDVRQLSGASVGSMTAAVVAAGSSAEEFTAFANDPALAGTITEGKSKAGMLLGSRITGEGLKTLMRAKLSDTLRKRITEYLEGTKAAGGQPDDMVLKLLGRLADNAHGPTFGDLRALAKAIPAVKELSVSASYMYEVDSAGKQVGLDSPQLAMFNANTEPQLEVAIAVQASAALPPIFKPVDITLASGIIARFQDGGVLNNVPTADSLGVGRDVDPMPDYGSINFVFESDAAHEALDGKAAPHKSALNDWITDAPNSAANYATYRGLADKPEDIVMVPLIFSVPAKNAGGKATVKDFSGLLSGTANFDIAQDDKLKLQELTEAATAAHIARRQQPKTQVFASADQMLMCIGRADLAALAQDGFEGAKDALAFRDAVVASIGKLSAKAQSMSGKPAMQIAASDDVAAELRQLDALARNIPERTAFIGREMNRSGALDRMIAAGNAPSQAMQAAAAVADALKAKAHARTILRDMIYPRMVDEDPKGINAGVLAQADTKLRAAASSRDVNAALTTVIRHYQQKRDLLGLHGCKKFAAQLVGYMM